MKKLYYLIVLALILGLVLTGCLLSNVGQVPTSTDQSGITYLTRNSSGELYTEANPFTTELLAGQTIDVGEVQVWNDAEYLYITYIIDESGWYLTETHLHVACDGDPIPVNKKDNPKPGQFEYCAEHDYATEYPLAPIPIDCCNPIIAAHAVVVDTNSTQIVSMVSNEGDTVYGPLYAETPIGSEDWGESKAATEAINEITDTNWQWGLEPFRPDVDIPDALWISTATYTEDNGASNSWRWFTEDLEVPEYPVLNSGILIINANNEYWAYLNGTQIGTDDWSFPPDGIESYFFDPIMGTNRFDFLVKNFPPEHPTNNPNGLTYKATAEYYETETAWADGTRFVEANDPDDPGVHGGGNWATYFIYTVQDVCPCILGKTPNIEVLIEPPANVSVGSLESDVNIRVWKEFEGPLPADLCYDLDESLSAMNDGPPSTDPCISVGEYVCIYYVHLDNIGSSGYIEKTGQITFGTDILGLIISGGNLGDFKDRDLMFIADDQIGWSGTTYPDGTSIYPPNVDYLRGFDVNYGSNLDDAIFNGPTVDFTMWVSNAHDSFRVIVPMVLPCE